MIDLIDTPKEEETVISESEEAANNIQKLLATNPENVEHELDEEEVIEYEPLHEGEVRFSHASLQSISMISANGRHISFPYVTSDEDLIAEIREWTEHVGCMTIEEFHGED